MLNLDELTRLEELAVQAKRDVLFPSFAKTESINERTNQEMLYIRAVRADQAVAAWWMANAEPIKEILRNISAYEKSLTSCP